MSAQTGETATAIERDGVEPARLGRLAGLGGLGGLADRVATKLVAPAPAERLAALRVLVGGFAVVYLVVRIPHVMASAALPEHRWQPVGILGRLGQPPPPVAVVAGVALTFTAGVGFVAGWRWRLSGPTFAVGMVALMTYGVSWGHVRHTENLLVLHLVVLAAAPAAAAWSVDRRRHPAPTQPTEEVTPSGRYGFPVRLVSIVTVLTYAIAGWAKLRNGGWSWLVGDVLRNHIAVDNLRKVVLGDRWSPLGGALVGHRWLWPPVGVATLIVELGAPVALLVRRARAPWAVSAWLFHVGTLALMAIMFPYPLSGIAFASLFPVERAVDRVRRRVAWRAWRGAGWRACPPAGS